MKIVSLAVAAMLAVSTMTVAGLPQDDPPQEKPRPRVAETEPVRVNPPPLMSWKLSVLVWPTMTGPKSMFVGLSTNKGGGFVTAIKLGSNRLPVPTGPLTVSTTLLVPARA